VTEEDVRRKAAEDEDETGADEVRAWEPGEQKTRKDEPAKQDAPADADEAAGEPAGPEDTEGEGRRLPVIQTPARIIVALVCAVIATVSLVWIGTEQHYQSCVNAAAARSAGANDALSRLVRGRAVNNCSHWPF
jgi:hypothetical protein